MKKVIFAAFIEKILDPEMYHRYISQVPPIIEAHNGTYIARSSRITPLCGSPPQRTILIGFDSMDQAKACFTSPEYRKIKHLRDNSTTSTAFFIENQK